MFTHSSYLVAFVCKLSTAMLCGPFCFQIVHCYMLHGVENNIFSRSETLSRLGLVRSWLDSRNTNLTPETTKSELTPDAPGHSLFLLTHHLVSLFFTMSTDHRQRGLCAIVTSRPKRKTLNNRVSGLPSSLTDRKSGNLPTMKKTSITLYRSKNKAEK